MSDKQESEVRSQKSESATPRVQFFLTPEMPQGLFCILTPDF